MNALNGWKSYVLAAVGVIFNGLVSMGYISESVRPTVDWALMFLLGATIRHGITTTVSDATNKKL